jgi:dihydrofolate reductase
LLSSIYKNPCYRRLNSFPDFLRPLRLCGNLLAFFFAVKNPKPIHLIVAVAHNGVIGRGGRLPWDLPEDWQHFLNLTRGGILIHGRKCQDHHGPPLPEREVIVLSRNPSYQLPGAQVVRSLPEALTLAQASPHPGPIWIGGGAEIYRAALPLADKVFVTDIELDPEGDIRLPWELFTQAGFTKVLEVRAGALGAIKYTFKVLGHG